LTASRDTGDLLKNKKVCGAWLSSYLGALTQVSAGSVEEEREPSRIAFDIGRR